MTGHDEFPLGASYLGESRTRFVVWAPNAERVDVRLVAPEERIVRLEASGRGYHTAVVEGVEPGSRYVYRLGDSLERPDPASRRQPEGVHGPSEVADPAFAWDDAGWVGPALDDYVIYELHVGAFTAAGAFDAIVPHLDDLRDLGVTAIELMPIAEFPGARNWGYDGVDLYAAHHAYGGPDGLRRLVSACHRRGMALVLDVVYNHLGPEGNYLADFGPYFTDRYRTPWGAALNFDGADSDGVRRFFTENALMWVTDFHVDALRLDAVHAIVDDSALPFLEELAMAVHRRAAQLGRRVYLLPESDANDARLIRPRELGGLGHDAQWSDDFHHALHAVLTGERDGYYADFGSLASLAKAYGSGYVYTGEYSAYRRRRHGRPTAGLPPTRFIVFAQNHDQAGNRMLGERLSALASFESLKLAAGAVLLSPFVPLLFMGEEYGERAPFPYFVSHTNAELVDSVRRGRHDEFAAFGWRGEPRDPQAEATFRAAKLNRAQRDEPRGAALMALHRQLLALRREVPALRCAETARGDALAFEDDRVLFLRRWREGANGEAFAVFNFGDEPVPTSLPVAAGAWRRLLDSEDERWGGPGGCTPAAIESNGRWTVALPPRTFALYAKDE